MREYVGLLFIGDPHLAHRSPGARKDDYGRAILDKLRWAFAYAESERLLPCLLGDLFHYPRDNANWLVADFCELLVDREVLAIYGNHDVQENRISENDSISVPIKAGLLRMVSETAYWQGRINGRQVIVGGTPYGAFTPGPFQPGISGETLVFWMTHHDLMFPEYTPGRMEISELPGIHVVINGHIHRRMEHIQRRKTMWINPGNIARTSRPEGLNTPSVLRVDIHPGEWRETYVAVPCRPPEEVFVEASAPNTELPMDSQFIRGLAAIQSRRSGGEGLREFLDHNLGQFEPDVAAEVRRLANEVLQSV
jgi:DNA repair exonuclease SbcCD nuclease subunit